MGSDIYRAQVRVTMRGLSDGALMFQSSIIVGGIDREECDRELAARRHPCSGPIKCCQPDCSVCGDIKTLCTIHEPGACYEGCPHSYTFVEEAL